MMHLVYKEPTVILAEPTTAALLEDVAAVMNEAVEQLSKLFDENGRLVADPLPVVASTSFLMGRARGMAEALARLAAGEE